MEKNKKKKIIICVGGFAIFLICLLFIICNGKKKTHQPIDNEINQNTELEQQEIIEEDEENEYLKKIVSVDYSRYTFAGIIDKDLFMVSNATDYKRGIIDSKGNIIEDAIYRRIDILPDGYYLLEGENSKILKRKNNVIATNPETNKLYQDPNEENAPYVMISDECYDCYTTELKGNYRAANISKEYDTIGYNEEKKVKIVYGSIIYDAKEGKVIKEIPGRIRLDDQNNYFAIYNNSTYFAYSTYYDDNFENIVTDKNFFSGFQCGTNEYSEEIKNANSDYAGYFSIKQRKQILPLQYDTIYSHNPDETLFVVKKDGNYLLVNNYNTILLSGYDYMVNVNDYIITLNGNEFKIFDSNLNVLNEFTYVIDKSDEEVPKLNGGLCSSTHPYIYVNYKFFNYNYDKSYTEPVKVVFPTTEGIVALEITDQINKIDFDIKNMYNGNNNTKIIMNNGYSYLIIDNHVEIYKDNQIIKTVPIFIGYNEKFNYITVKDDNRFIIYELK